MRRLVRGIAWGVFRLRKISLRKRIPHEVHSKILENSRCYLHFRFFCSRCNTSATVHPKELGLRSSSTKTTRTEQKSSLTPTSKIPGASRAPPLIPLGPEAPGGSATTNSGTSTLYDGNGNPINIFTEAGGIAGNFVIVPPPGFAPRHAIHSHWGRRQWQPH